MDRQKGLIAFGMEIVIWHCCGLFRSGKEKKCGALVHCRFHFWMDRADHYFDITEHD